MVVDLDGLMLAVKLWVAFGVGLYFFIELVDR